MIFYLILFSSFLYSDTQCWTYSIYASGRRSSISQSVVWWCGIDYVGPTSHTYILRYADCVHVNSASGYRYDVIDWPSISRLPSWLLSRSLSSHIHRISLPSLSLTSLLFFFFFFSNLYCRLPLLFTPRNVHYAPKGSHSHVLSFWPTALSAFVFSVGGKTDNNCFLLYNSTHRSFPARRTITNVTNARLLCVYTHAQGWEIKV